MQKKILITVGGTGGHVYPALSLAQQLKKSNPALDILFAGGNLIANRYFEHGAFPYSNIACASFTKKNPLSLLKAFFTIGKGFFQSRKILKNFKPDLVIGFGSYYTLPALLAAKVFRSPFILHEANSIPGKVNRLMSPYAIMTGVHFPIAASKLKGNIVEVGIPLRTGFKQGSHSKAEAKKYFQLDPESPKKTLLIFGGSQGAAALNRIVANTLSQGSLNEHFQVIHLTGAKDQTDFFSALYQQKKIEFCVKDYESRMELAWQAADLAICRAGAGTIAEEMEFEVPALLVPYPYAADRHQDYNAKFMSETVRGALMCREKDLSAPLLEKLLYSFLENNFSKLEEMKKSIQEYKATKRQIDFTQLVIKVLNKG